MGTANNFRGAGRAEPAESGGVTATAPKAAEPRPSKGLARATPSPGGRASHGGHDSAVCGKPHARFTRRSLHQVRLRPTSTSCCPQELQPAPASHRGRPATRKWPTPGPGPFVPLPGMPSPSLPPERSAGGLHSPGGRHCCCDPCWLRSQGLPSMLSLRFPPKLRSSRPLLPTSPQHLARGRRSVSTC